ncbi:MAG: hypothetical protein AABZ47_16630 [Planctomycetota bacterium]
MGTTQATSKGKVSKSVRRCPACGHRLSEQDRAQCPLCNYRFGGERTTGADHTPYALAYEQGRSGWRTMSEWVWFAGTERLKHLALIRSSAASKRFVWLNLFLLMVGAGVFQFSEMGWHWVSGFQAVKESEPSHRPGFYWYKVASAPSPPAQISTDQAVELWWNPVQSILGIVSGVVLAMLFYGLGITILRALANSAMGSLYRHEERMTAAIRYGTAWVVPLVVAAVLAGMRPISYFGAIGKWSWYPPTEGFVLSAGCVGGLSLVLWWFWLLRLGSTAPPKVRARVTSWLAIGFPLLVAGAGAGWYVGLRFAGEKAFEAMRLAF